MPSAVAELARQGPGAYDRVALESLGIDGLTGLEVLPSSIARALPAFRWSSGHGDLVRNLVTQKSAKAASYRDRNPHLAEMWLALGPFGAGMMEEGVGALMDGK